LEGMGTHCFAEFYDCPAEVLNDESLITQAIRDAANAGFATLLHEVSHKFHPQGVTALGLIAESHIAIHTWPEHGYAAVDVFTCGNRANAEKACRFLADALQVGNLCLNKVHRGTALSPDAEAIPANACP
jgi:S-adenosylmethionine decarboxylase